MGASHCEVGLNSLFDHEQKEVFVNDSTNMTRPGEHILELTNHIQPARKVMRLFTTIVGLAIARGVTDATQRSIRTA